MVSLVGNCVDVESTDDENDLHIHILGGSFMEKTVSVADRICVHACVLR